MRGFVWGAAMGATAMWLWLNGFGPIVDTVANTWATASRPSVVDTKR